jgi:hypothetical protein
MSGFQPDPNLVATLAMLSTKRVEFVLVGDLAAAIYDDGGIVSGVAIVPGSYGRNVDRLASALAALNADLGIAGRPDPRGIDWRQTDLREIAPCSFMTAYADIDIDFEPAGTSGYRDLFQDADRYEIGRGARPYVVSPDDLDRVMHGAGSPAPAAPLPRLADPAPPPAPRPLAPDPRPAAIRPPEPEPYTAAEDDYDPGIWTEEEFNAIRSGRITY